MLAAAWKHKQMPLMNALAAASAGQAVLVTGPSPPE